MVDIYTFITPFRNLRKETSKCIFSTNKLFQNSEFHTTVVSAKFDVQTKPYMKYEIGAEVELSPSQQ